MTRTLIDKRFGAFRGNGKGCTSWIFLLVLSNFFFLHKHKKKHIISPRINITIASRMDQSSDHMQQISGEGEE